MRICVLHRVPFAEVGYDKVIDHDVHEVLYIGPKAALADIPSGLRCQKLERPGIAATWEEVLAVLVGKPTPERVVSLSEFELLDAARVRERLNIPGKRPEEILTVRDKVKMKGAIHAAGLRAPRFISCEALVSGSAGTPPWTGKTVLKPRDGACSRDTLTFPTAADAVAAVGAGTTGIRSFRIEQFELEEFVEGPVFHVDAAIVDGRLQVAMASRNLNTPLEYARGLPLGSVELGPRPDLERFAEACSRALGHHNGVFHLEGILSGEGPVFIEMGARAGACSIVDVVELGRGAHLYRVMLSVEVFGRVDLTAAARHQRTAPAYGWFVFPGHNVGRGGMKIVGAERFARDPHVVRWVQLPDGHPSPDHITYAPEDSPISGIIQGRDTADVEAFLTELFRTVRIQAQP
ncbi:MAG: acetyl-CoA carboxylase biotin carboxylase subunit family protein [Hyalangium sp.]|uniref:ATP-grasp domain-containing protein n=1 Tax=Hyalangium sp. TaxID=2028555 RepID=UPI003899E8CC